MYNLIPLYKSKKSIDVLNDLEKNSQKFSKNNSTTDWLICFLCSPADIAEGMIELVEDDTKNGKAMRITRAYGRDYAEFQEQPIQ